MCSAGNDIFSTSYYKVFRFSTDETKYCESNSTIIGLVIVHRTTSKEIILIPEKKPLNIKFKDPDQRKTDKIWNQRSRQDGEEKLIDILRINNTFGK